MAFGIGIAFYQRIRRGRIQQRYNQLIADTPMGPIRMDDETSESGSEDELLNVTETTLGLPPSQGSSATAFVNSGFRATSSPNVSSDASTNFLSASSSVNDDHNSTIIAPTTSTAQTAFDSPTTASTSTAGPSNSGQASPVHPQQENIGQKTPVAATGHTTPTTSSTPTTEQSNVDQGSPVQHPLANIDQETPVAASSTSIGSFVDRMRNVTRQRNRRTVSQSDPTRVQPKRLVKKERNYKE